MCLQVLFDSKPLALPKAAWKKRRQGLITYKKLANNYAKVAGSQTLAMSESPAELVNTLIANPTPMVQIQ